MKFIIYFVLQFYTSLKVLEVSFSRSQYWWCDEDDRYHHFLFCKLHPKVWESQLKYLILKGYHPKRTCRVGEEGYTCISFRMCPCINSFDMLWLCWLFAYVFILAYFFFKFVLYLLFLLILLFMFCFLVCWKFQKPIKIEKSPKTLIASVVYIT